jgi:hypothetical protein
MMNFERIGEIIDTSVGNADDKLFPAVHDYDLQAAQRLCLYEEMGSDPAESPDLDAFPWCHYLDTSFVIQNRYGLDQDELAAVLARADKVARLDLAEDLKGVDNG